MKILNPSTDAVAHVARAVQVGAPIVLGTCVIDLISAKTETTAAPQLLVMMTPSVAVPGENMTFPPVPPTLERRFKALAEQLRQDAGGAK